MKPQTASKEYWHIKAEMKHARPMTPDRLMIPLWVNWNGYIDVWEGLPRLKWIISILGNNGFDIECRKATKEEIRWHDEEYRKGN